jgi:uncharacterized Fe-S cluster-containing MiaB family protein
VTKNKYFDKHEKWGRLIMDVFGGSITFAKSDEAWVSKRKHISTAFYKDKTFLMLKNMLVLSSTAINDWIERGVK